jgi:hypothetical protein
MSGVTRRHPTSGAHARDRPTREARRPSARAGPAPATSPPALPCPTHLLSPWSYRSEIVSAAARFHVTDSRCWIVAFASPHPESIDTTLAPRRLDRPVSSRTNTATSARVAVTGSMPWSSQTWRNSASPRAYASIVRGARPRSVHTRNQPAARSCRPSTGHLSSNLAAAKPASQFRGHLGPRSSQPRSDST